MAKPYSPDHVVLRAHAGAVVSAAAWRGLAGSAARTEGIQAR